MQQATTSTQLPPIRTLVTFETACRHRSLLRAAEELNMTPSAVSQHVSKLEQLLGIRLFRRMARGVEPTIDGEIYAEEVRLILARLGMATRRLVDGSRRQPIRIALDPAISTYWFFPYLEEIADRFPEMHLDFVGTSRVGDAVQRDADFVIEYGDLAEARAAGHIVLFPRTSTPVCARSFHDKYGPFEEVDSLYHFPLIHNLVSRDEWREWFSTASRETVPIAHHNARGRSLSLAAAERGLGFALGCRNMLRREIETGSFVAPFTQQFEYPQGYFVIVSRVARQTRFMESLTRWFMSKSVEARSSYPADPGA